MPREKTIITNPTAQNEEYFQICKALMEKAFVRKQKKMWEQGQIFISYRNKCYDQVMELKKRIKTGEYHQGASKTVIIIPEGRLVTKKPALPPADIFSKESLQLYA